MKVSPARHPLGSLDSGSCLSARVERRDTDTPEVFVQALNLKVDSNELRLLGA